MKKILFYILVICVIVSIFSLNKYFEKKSVIDNFETYLTTYNYQNDVLSKEARYDSKMGEYYMLVYYKKYPERRYEYYFLNNYISGVAYESGVYVKTPEYLKGTKRYKGE